MGARFPIYYCALVDDRKPPQLDSLEGEWNDGTSPLVDKQDYSTTIKLGQRDILNPRKKNKRTFVFVLTGGSDLGGAITFIVFVCASKNARQAAEKAVATVR